MCVCVGVRGAAQAHLAGQQQAAAAPAALPDRPCAAAFKRKGAEQGDLASAEEWEEYRDVDVLEEEHVRTGT